MATKREIEDQAKALLETQPEEAYNLYKNLYENFSEQFNGWDAFYMIKAMRSCNVPDISLANELVKKYSEEKVSNVYGWLIFDKCIKGKNRSDIIGFENYIVELPSLCPQKNLRENNKFPCPTTISILRICDAYAENLFNSKKIDELLSLIDYNLLSTQTKTIESPERGDIELASDLEKYFALKTKALIKLKEYAQCIEYCKIGLSEINKFHYNNDLWFKMRIALAEEGQGNHEGSEKLFHELLNSKAGSDKWFLYRDISEVYFEKEDYLKAWKYAVDAAFYGNEPHFLIGLYYHQTKILFKLNRINDGRILAELIAAILKEQKWGDRVEYNKLFTYFKIEMENLAGVSELFKKATTFWTQERYGLKSKITGTIISISHNGKGGKIKSIVGEIIIFQKKDLIKKQKTIENLRGAEVEFYKMESYDGKSIAENIAILKSKEISLNKEIVGKIFNGTVSKVAEFGIFFTLPQLPNGLLHRNNLPANLKDNFIIHFPIGKIFKVIIERVTEKGIQLKLSDN